MKVEGKATPKSETYLMDHTLHITYGRNTYRYLVRQWASPCVMHTRGDRCTFLVPFKKTRTSRKRAQRSRHGSATQLLVSYLGRLVLVCVVWKRASGSTVPTLWLLKTPIRLPVRRAAMTGETDAHTTAAGVTESPRDGLSLMAVCSVLYSFGGTLNTARPPQKTAGKIMSIEKTNPSVHSSGERG